MTQVDTLRYCFSYQYLRHCNVGLHCEIANFHCEEHIFHEYFRVPLFCHRRNLRCDWEFRKHKFFEVLESWKMLKKAGNFCNFCTRPEFLGLPCWILEEVVRIWPVAGLKSRPNVIWMTKNMASILIFVNQTRKKIRTSGTFYMVPQFLTHLLSTYAVSDIFANV